MKRLLGICVLVGFYSTIAVAQQQKSHKADFPKGHAFKAHAGNASGEFTRHETATVRRIEKRAHRIEREAEKNRDAKNNRRKIDARRAEKSLAKRNS